MSHLSIKRSQGLRGSITPPPDKSISHRSILFASLARGDSRIKNLLYAGDTKSTMTAMGMLGIRIDNNGADVIVHGKGLRGLSEPLNVIDCGNSGTTTRLLAGILAGNPFFSALTGDDSLRQRPMARVINPLLQMGARIDARKGGAYLPMSIRGGGLRGIDYVMPVSSAQVKSCLILAGLYAEGLTSIKEPSRSRDHTEKMLRSMGAEIIDDGGCLQIKPPSTELGPIDIFVPADFSSAAFFIAAALIVPNSEVVIREVLINPTRSGLLNVLNTMGADIAIENIRYVSGEQVADLHCKSTDNLRAVSIGSEVMPSMIDEFPILCIIATQAEGITHIRGAEELRYKESDRIKVMVSGLSALGVQIEEHPDGVSIMGKTTLRGSSINCSGDHRIAMSMAVAGLISEKPLTIEDPECVAISFPSFFETLEALRTN